VAFTSITSRWTDRNELFLNTRFSVVSMSATGWARFSGIVAGVVESERSRTNRSWGGVAMVPGAADKSCLTATTNISLMVVRQHYPYTSAHGLPRPYPVRGWGMQRASYDEILGQAQGEGGSSHLWGSLS